MNPLETDDEFSISLRNPNPSFRALKSGDVYRVDFELSKEEWEYFTDPNIDRAGMVLEMTGMVTHRAPKPSVGEISYVPATTLPVSTESAPVKGGMWSQEAGKACNNPRFQEYMKHKNPDYWRHSDSMEKFLEKQDCASGAMKEILNIESRKELDTDVEARKRFKQLMHDFNRWTATTLPSSNEQALKKYEFG